MRVREYLGQVLPSASNFGQLLPTAIDNFRHFWVNVVPIRFELYLTNPIFLEVAFD